MNVSSRIPERSAPPKASAEIAKGILAMGFSEVEIFSAPNDHERGRETVRLADDARVHTADDVRSFGEFAEQIASCEYLITVDTSAIQLGAAVGVPMLVLFNPTPGEHLWTPRGVDFVGYMPLPTLQDLEPQQALDLFKQLTLRQQKPGPSAPVPDKIHVI